MINDISPILIIPCGTCGSSASTRSPPAMRTAMRRTACAVTPCSNSAWIGCLWSRSTIWPVLPPCLVWSTVSPAKTSIGSPQAFVDHFLARYPAPPAPMVLDLDHSDDPTYGQQEFAFYNHYYQNYRDLPLFIFEGTSHALVTACLRSGTRPPGAENAMILVRLLSYLRRHWPHTHILVRGESHCATPRGHR